MGDEATYFEAYGHISYGNEMERCRGDQECLPGLKCLPDLLTAGNGSASVCKFPEGLEWEPTRTEYDPECHRITKQGTRVSLPQHMCPPPLALPPPHPSSQEVCAGAQEYHHLLTGKSFCVTYLGDENVTRAPKECCDANRKYSGELDAEYLKFARSPQYYGVWR